MIIVNYWLQKGCDPLDDGYELYLAGIVNDSLDLWFDPELLKEAINNDDNFKPKEETLYEIYLTRAARACDPIPENCFIIDRVVEKVYSSNGEWVTPLVHI